jgi:hypothetical protein
MIERALALFTPFYRPPDLPATDRPAATEEIAALRAEVESLKRQLAESKTPPPPSPPPQSKGEKEALSSPEPPSQTRE